jgi:hypothetical protein
MIEQYLPNNNKKYNVVLQKILDLNRSWIEKPVRGGWWHTCSVALHREGEATREIGCFFRAARANIENASVELLLRSRPALV